MPVYTLGHLSNEHLLTEVAALLATDRQVEAALLAHLAEVDARELFLAAACSTMHVYCVQVLRLSEDVAYKRMRAARAARRFPQLFDALADGRLHVSGVAVLAPHLTDENVDAIIAEATHRTKADLEVIAARLKPRPDLPELMLPTTAADGHAHEVTNGERPAPGPDAVPPPAARVKPLAPNRYALQTTIDQTTRDKLERAKALLRHVNPTGDLATVLDRALDALLETLEKAKFGKTTRPRAKKERPADADPRYTQNADKRALHERDGGQCAWVSDDGVRCSERGMLELDHVTPVCLGGKPGVKTQRWVCHAHNQHEAELQLGVDFMREKRAQARAARAARAERAECAGKAATDANGAPPTSKPTRKTDLELALRGMGFKATETRDALARQELDPGAPFEERLRAALAELTRMRGNRCSDGAFDAQSTWSTSFGPPSYARA